MFSKSWSYERDTIPKPVGLGFAARAKVVLFDARSLNIRWIFNGYSMVVQSAFDGRSTSSAGRRADVRGISGRIDMDDKVNEILDRLPAKPPRSRLDPHAALIEEMRRRGRTFAEIARVLAGRVPGQHLPEQHTSFHKASGAKGKASEANQCQVCRFQHSRIPAGVHWHDCVAANAINRCGAENRGAQTAQASAAASFGGIRLRSQ